MSQSSVNKKKRKIDGRDLIYHLCMISKILLTIHSDINYCNPIHSDCVVYLVETIYRFWSHHL